MFEKKEEEEVSFAKEAASAEEKQKWEDQMDKEIAEEATALQALNRPSQTPAEELEPADDEDGELPEYRFVEAERILKSEVPALLKTTLEDMHEEGYGFISHSAFEGYRSKTVDLLLIFRLEE